MKKTGLFLALAVLLCAGLSSCNSDNNYDGTPTPLSWVDLGLPSGLLWASQNLGALSPVDYGDYFAWGEKTPKEVYGWETYAYGYDWNMLTKYCSSDGLGWNGYTDTLTNLEVLLQKEDPEVGDLVGRNGKFYGTGNDAKLDGTTPVGIVIYRGEEADPSWHPDTYGLALSLKDVNIRATIPFSKNATTPGPKP